MIVKAKFCGCAECAKITLKDGLKVYIKESGVLTFRKDEASYPDPIGELNGGFVSFEPRFLQAFAR